MKKNQKWNNRLLFPAELLPKQSVASPRFVHICAINVQKCINVQSVTNFRRLMFSLSCFEFISRSIKPFDSSYSNLEAGTWRHMTSHDTQHVTMLWIFFIHGQIKMIRMRTIVIVCCWSVGGHPERAWQARQETAIQREKSEREGRWERPWIYLTKFVLNISILETGVHRSRPECTLPGECHLYVVVIMN
jgi:hypothetical protein